MISLMTMKKALIQMYSKSLL